MNQLSPATVFIVRVSCDDAGRLTGSIVEQVKTGQKERAQGVEDIGPVIARMLARDREEAGAGA